MSISLDNVDVTKSTIQIHHVEHFKVKADRLSSCVCTEIEIKTKEETIIINLYT